MFGYSLANQSSTLVKFQISKRQGLQKIKILGWGDDSIMLRGFVTLHKYEERPEFKCTKVTQRGEASQCRRETDTTALLELAGYQLNSRFS